MSLKIKNPIFILNAPPRTGKDTVARYMYEMPGNIVSPVLSASFKTPIFNIFYASVPVSVGRECDELYDTDWKDTPHALLNNKSPRELFIHISETYIKPFFGNDYFGKYVAEFIRDNEGLVGESPWVIPDGGFDKEVEILRDIFGDRVVVVQITRPGFESFGKDSRRFINVEGVHTIKETNEDGSEALAARLMGMIDYD